MKLGICVPHYGRPIEVERMLAVVRHAEESGLDSAWVTDHVIVPRDVDVIYREHMLDPLAPVAKLLASVAVLSGGRLMVGAAIGWLEGEFDALGVPFKERVSRSEEALELFRTLWTHEHPEIETKRHRLRDVTFSPMPLQKPRPPIYVGGNSEAALRRVARLGDGWHSTGTSVDAFRQGVETVRRFWAEARRHGEPALSLRIPIVIDGVHRPAVDMELIRGRGRHVIGGPVDKIVEELRGFQAHGCEHIALEVSYSTYPAILQTIDVIAERLRPAVVD